MRALLLISVALVVLLPLGGCARTGYYLQSVGGQLDLLSRRVPVEKLIEDPETDPELRERLIAVTAIRDFASAELGLPDNRSYRSYADLGRPYVVWNVFAAPEFSVEPKKWCFLFVGCLSYRGYFREERARAYAAKLSEEGFDVYVAGIAAYSTLGRFADPVMNTMLYGDDLYLAGLIFHELAHQQLYIKDSTVFNESFATLVGEEGVRRWLASRDENDAWERWRVRDHYRDEFNALVTGTRERLAALYASGMTEDRMRARKAEIIDEMRADYVRLREDWGGYRGYDRWFEGPLNNAQLGSVATYQLLVPAFRALLAEAGGDMPAFYRHAAELGELPAEKRDARLDELTAE